MRKICVRVIAFTIQLLIFISLFALPAGAVDHQWSVPGKKTAAYLRVFADPDSRNSWIGHYDLQIIGKLRIGKHQFTDPCFSYASGGIMYIFSAADSSLMYKGSNYDKCRAYTLRFEIPTSKLSPFIRYLDGELTSSKAIGSKRALKCRFKSSSPFRKYNTATVNCFSAVAYWLRGFGVNSLWKLYTNVYKTGNNYLPRTFIKNNISKLKRVK